MSSKERDACLSTSFHLDLSAKMLQNNGFEDFQNG